MAEQETWAEFYGLGPGPIDIDRGVTMRTISNGGKIAMYKDMPGLYLDPMGNEVDDRFAEEAGFDIEGDRREAQLRKKIRESEAKIRAQAEAELAKLHEDSEAEKAAAGNPLSVSPPAIATETNAAGQPRGTQNFVMEHRGGPNWNVVERATQDVIAENVTQDVAIDKMMAAQRDFDADEVAAS